jgi:hypothetical protein
LREAWNRCFRELQEINYPILKLDLLLLFPLLPAPCSLLPLAD